jgi:MoaA/NifB/PqqE/SkfB family radical SAM enzyme
VALLQQVIDFNALTFLDPAAANFCVAIQNCRGTSCSSIAYEKAQKVDKDSHSMAAHERNRGVRGVGERIRKGVAAAHRHRITAISVVTVNHLVSYEQLPALLKDLGFNAVSFSYPRKEPFGSSPLVYGSDSKLVDFTPDQLLAALDAIKSLKSKFPVMNPTAALDDIKRYVRGEEQLIACVGGHKYFYLDWNLQIWRCEAWHEPLGSVFDLDRIADRRDLHSLHPELLSRYQYADACRRGDR